MWDAAVGRGGDLEDRIKGCRMERQRIDALPRESEDLNALTAFVANASRGMSLAVSIDGPARAAFERAREFYHLRQGQMNLSCASCHEQSAGKRLLAGIISPGQGNAVPAHRLG